MEMTTETFLFSFFFIVTAVLRGVLPASVDPFCPQRLKTGKAAVPPSLPNFTLIKEKLEKPPEFV
ncbi:MAG: hypothetical protein R6V02_08045 [Candidatus Aminicenantes bacterium]